MDIPKELKELPSGLLSSAVWAALGAGVLWATRAIALNSQLTGRWSGRLTYKGESLDSLKSHAINCVLVFASPSGKNSGLIYYHRVCTVSSKVISQGLDDLVDYTCCGGTFFVPEITMKLVRLFHKNQKGQIESRIEADAEFKCKLVGRFTSNPKLHVETKIKSCGQSDLWDGTFKKQN